MVAKGYDWLNERVKRGIDIHAPDDPNGVDSYQHLFYGEGWQEQRRIIGKADGGRGHEAILEILDPSMTGGRPPF